MFCDEIDNKPLIELLNFLTTVDLDKNFCQKIASAINFIKSKEDDFNDLFYPDFYEEVWGEEHGLIITAFILKNPKIKSVVGNGLFCTVFEGVDGLIYKISTNRIRYDVSADFYKHCINNKNPLFPKIYQLSIVGNDYCLSTEKLTEMDLTEYEELELYSLNESVAEGDVLYFKSCLRYGTKATPEQMKEIFNILHTLHDEHECRLDMFSSNFMHRGEELVFNDPLSMGFQG